MKLELFDNNIGFKPQGRLLDLWKTLPQVQIDHNAPSLFGNIKSMVIPFIMVVLLLIGGEIALIYTLNDEGAQPTTLIALLAIDFAIAIVPIGVANFFNLIPSVIKTRLFIENYKLNTKHEIPTGKSELSYHEDLRDNISKFKGQKFGYYFIFLATVIGLFFLAYQKYKAIYGIFGEDIFIIGVGRLGIGMILIGLITHIFFTKDFITYIIFRFTLYFQYKNFKESNLNKIQENELNKEKEIVFDGKFNFAKANRQMIGKVINSMDSTMDKNKLVSFSSIQDTKYVSTMKTDDNLHVNIIHSGLLTDPEISELISAQSDSRLSVLCTAKEIQLSFS